MCPPNVLRYLWKLIWSYVHILLMCRSFYISFKTVYNQYPLHLYFKKAQCLLNSLSCWIGEIIPNHLSLFSTAANSLSWDQLKWVCPKNSWALPLAIPTSRSCCCDDSEFENLNILYSVIHFHYHIIHIHTDMIVSCSHNLT